MSVTARTWRAAFLTLRDETLASPSRSTVCHLINQLIYSQSDSLIAAAAELPPHEATSDVMLLVKLAADTSHSGGAEDIAQSFVKLSHLIHGVSHCTLLQINSTHWTLLLDSLRRILQILLCEPKIRSSPIPSVSVIKATKICLESVRHLFGVYNAASLLSENEQLLVFLLQVVGCFPVELVYSSHISDNHKVSGYNCVCEVLAVAFIMIDEVYSRVGSSLPVDIWQSTIEVLRKVMDSLASKSLLVEDNVVARFYMELLHCLHSVLKEPKGYLAGHVAAFVAALRIFFRYGLANKSHVPNQAASQKTEVGSTSKNSEFAVSNKSRIGPYRPPHMRKKVLKNLVDKDEESLVSPEYDSSSDYLSSSDSDCSDNDGSVTESCNIHFAKTRLAAIVCIQDLCRSDPKLFTGQWAAVLPSSDVLQSRKYETTLMSCLLFDPYLKVRIAAASTITAMLDGPASVFLQVAEFRDPSKCGSFTALSSSLGQILMQLHLGTLYLIKHEAHNRLLLLSFKILMLLMSCTPYSRMSEELLSMVISSVKSRINAEFPFLSDRHNLLAAAINCLSIALSVSPSSMHVNDMLLVEVSKGLVEVQPNSGVISTLCRYSEQALNPAISLEAFQALKALAHNYPNVMGLCWERISSIVHGVFSCFSEVPRRSWRGNVEQTVNVQEKVMTAAIKVLDECLRAISGFKGTEDLSNDKFPVSPFTSDYIKTKAISSAPSYGLKSPASTEDECKTYLLASERWIEATVKHFPVIITHSSATVRAAAVTCYAGMTSSVFLLLPKDKQEYIISSTINAALSDEVPSVRSAACRAIGVIACFPQIYVREVLAKFIHAVEYNSRDSLVSVRITASWALANICDSLSHCMNTQHLTGSSTESWKSYLFMPLLINIALRLTSDNDKVKANSVRALGNLSRSVQFSSQPPICGVSEDFMPFNLEYNGMKPPKHDERERSDSFMSASSGTSDWLGNMVQAFLSCVATGNVKVQWNVCHALSNLFSNRTLKLQDMEWACSVFSILLLLLRDSSNFKIRIQAAAALAVPESINDYGQSYYDVFKGVEHIVESFKSDQVSEPSNFKYWIALEKQLTSTMLHLLGLAATCDQQAVQDLLVKKASFLEVWIKGLCSSVGDTNISFYGLKHVASVNQKKDVLSIALHALIEVYESSNHHSISQRFHRVANSLL